LDLGFHEPDFVIDPILDKIDPGICAVNFIEGIVVQERLTLFHMITTPIPNHL